MGITNMQILIQSLDVKSPQPVQGGAGIGYWCEFASPLARGRALFIPRGPAIESYAGKSPDVRAEAGSVSEIRPLPAGEAETFQWIQLETPGDYRAKGRTVSLVWLDDEREDAILEVLVGEEVFSIPAGSLDDAPVEFGEWVTFRIHRLVLWERGE